MSRLFSPEWSNELAILWNKDSQMTHDLSAISFAARIGFGFLDEEQPHTILNVHNGKVESIAPHQEDELDWDLRALEEDWKHWMKEGFGLQKLGLATSSGKLKFLAGDYRRMIRTQEMSRPFLRFFDLMMQIKTD